MVHREEELPAISFETVSHQRRWLALTAAGSYLERL
jgi:hypothetical protein